ncbi:hypothetical protein MA16_Dca000005 [Dendrobium catenatum]|uniref:Uncharacterized protein n=1 Tax=Dendrobium catenatum TaxID=906689 RepID=A0A2I0WSL8_9ASPA|nr:hypothetical protein MA16_Dca000005 [Dendrobium catenatum]
MRQAEFTASSRSAGEAVFTGKDSSRSVSPLWSSSISDWGSEALPDSSMSDLASWSDTSCQLFSISELLPRGESLSDLQLLSSIAPPKQVSYSESASTAGPTAGGPLLGNES